MAWNQEYAVSVGDWNETVGSGPLEHPAKAIPRVRSAATTGLTRAELLGAFDPSAQEPSPWSDRLTAILDPLSVEGAGSGAGPRLADGMPRQRWSIPGRRFVTPRPGNERRWLPLVPSPV